MEDPNIESQLAKINSFFADFMKNLNLKPFYQIAGTIIENSIIQQFETEGKRFGSNWAPLAKSTVKQRERLGYTPINILRRRSGNAGLLGSINYKATSEGITVGTNKIYAAIQNFGGTVNIPARTGTSKWKATKNKQTKKYNYRFAKNKSKLTKRTIERSYNIPAYSITIPARPFIGTHKDDIADISEAFLKFITQNL